MSQLHSFSGVNQAKPESNGEIRVGTYRFSRRSKVKEFVLRHLSRAYRIQPYYLTCSEKQALLVIFSQWHPVFQDRFPEGAAGVADVSIEPSQTADMAVTFTGKDGRKEPLSAQKLFVPREYLTAKRLLEASRNEVLPDVWAYRDEYIKQTQLRYEDASKMFRCEICGLWFGLRLLSVDHFRPFSEIFHTWKEECGLCDDSIRMEKREGLWRFTDEAQSWRDYHRAHATLLCVNRDLNSRLSNVDKGSAEAKKIIKEFKSTTRDFLAPPQLRQKDCLDQEDCPENGQRKLKWSDSVPFDSRPPMSA